jgi:hypothetical protein
MKKSCYQCYLLLKLLIINKITVTKTCYFSVTFLLSDNNQVTGVLPLSKVLYNIINHVNIKYTVTFGVTV